jgi:hypothetical protein
VWITYDPSLPSNDVQSLRGFVRQTEKVPLSPVAGQNAPIIATAWVTQLELDDPSDARLGQFVNEFSDSSSAPEPAVGALGALVTRNSGSVRQD